MNKTILLLRVVLSFALAFSIFVSAKIIPNELALTNFLYRADYSEKNVNMVLNKWNFYESKEKIVVGIFNSQLSADLLNFNQIEYLSDILLSTNQRSAQGFYLKTVISERKNDLNGALKFIYKAIELDPLNTTYLLGLSVLQINLLDYSGARKTLNYIEEIDPTTKNLESIKDLLPNVENK